MIGIGREGIWENNWSSPVGGLGIFALALGVNDCNKSTVI
jgi:hypothetical protein